MNGKSWTSHVSVIQGAVELISYFFPGNNLIHLSKKISNPLSSFIFKDIVEQGTGCVVLREHKCDEMMLITASFYHIYTLTNRLIQREFCRGLKDDFWNHDAQEDIPKFFFGKCATFLKGLFVFNAI